MAERELLEVRDLRVHFSTDDGLVKAVDGISSQPAPGPDSASSASPDRASPCPATVLGLQGKGAQISGEIWLSGEKLVGAGPGPGAGAARRQVAMIFQDPLSSLHPY